MNYCQTEHYETLLKGIGIATKREVGALFRRRRLWEWDAIGLTADQAFDVVQMTTRPFPRLLSVPGRHQFGTPMESYAVDLPLDISGKEMRGVRAGVNRSRAQGVTVRMVNDFTDWCFTAEDLWPKHRRDAEWQYYGGQHAHFVAFHNNEVVGTLGFYHWDGVATEIMSRVTDKGLNIQELLHVEAMRYAATIGCSTFVLGSSGTKGIQQFKAKFRGRTEWITNTR